MKNNEAEFKLLNGTIRDLVLKTTTIEFLFSGADQPKMAGAGSLAAALGLSGIAAGMATMSSEEIREPVTNATFYLNDIKVMALLWAFPFKEGDDVQVVAEPSEGYYIGFAVLNPKEKIIALYPHVSAGSKAHWKNVIKLSSVVGGAAAIFGGTMGLLSLAAVGDEPLSKSLPFVGLCMIAVMCLFFLIGCRIGRRFIKFTKMAERIFLSLGWKNVGDINLRKITKIKIKPEDSHLIGDRCFRY